MTYDRIWRHVRSVLCMLHTTQPKAEPVTVSVAAATNALIEAAEARGIALDPMKLQKLLYLTHGYYHAVTGRPWVDEAFEAWDYGPVAPSLYREFRQYGAKPLKRGERMTEVGFDDDGDFDLVAPVADLAADPKAKRVLDFVLDRYGSKSAIYLSDLTHKVGSPWHKVKQRGSALRNQDIPNSDIQEHFAKLVKK